MSLALASHPSSQAFELINQALQDPAERKDAIKKGGAIFSFVLKADGKEESWYIDLKDKGEVGRGAAPEGGKADGKPLCTPRKYTQFPASSGG